MSKKTYRVGANWFTNRIDAATVQHCILGIYLVERHGFQVHEYLGPHAYGFSVYDVLESDPAIIDLKKMESVFAKYKELPIPGDAWANVAKSNNCGAPLSVIQEALVAVGVDVDLIEGRPVHETDEWNSWPNAASVPV